MAEKNVTVTKRKAATCQLETGIKLFFENHDLISAYTLCCAADGIVEGIYQNERAEIIRKQCDNSGTANSLQFSWAEELDIHIKSEHKREVFRALNAPQNFFKHADRDHESSYAFPDWELTGVRITTTIRNYNLVFREITPPMNVFFTLYGVLHPELLAEGNPLLTALGMTQGFKALSREDVAAIGYSVLKSTCPELFEKPRIVSSVRSGVFSRI